MAGADLIHHPNNGTVLFTDKDSISSGILNEIKRLNPVGSSEGTHVMVMGNRSEAAKSQLSDYKVEQIKNDKSEIVQENGEGYGGR